MVARFFNALGKAVATQREILRMLKQIQCAVGRIETRQIRQRNSRTLGDWEFQVSSQGGEDGIIQMLIEETRPQSEIFVEFGVETYTESNTRFLLQNNNWSGLVIDGSESNIGTIKRDPIYWRYNLKAHCSFVTAENINELITAQGIEGEIGLLSIDVDGNDYWIWSAIHCVNPVIVVCEYNSLFGPQAKIAIPYDRNFDRGTAHFSHLYFGASIAALADLAEQKGYVLVGSNTTGNNAFFVRKDKCGDLPRLEPQQAYVKSKFRESRSRQGALTFEGHEQALSSIKSLPVVETTTKRTVRIDELLNV